MMWGVDMGRLVYVECGRCKMMVVVTRSFTVMVCPYCGKKQIREGKV